MCLIFVCCRAGVGRCLLPELFVCLSGGCTGRARPPLAEGELSVVLLLFGRHRLSAGQKVRSPTSLTNIAPTFTLLLSYVL